jgi:hypothetical protein
MEQDRAQSELQREVRDYIESLKPAWHEALSSFEVSKTIEDPRKDPDADARR